MKNRLSLTLSSIISFLMLLVAIHVQAPVALAGITAYIVYIWTYRNKQKTLLNDASANLFMLAGLACLLQVVIFHETIISPIPTPTFIKLFKFIAEIILSFMSVLLIYLSIITLNEGDGVHDERSISDIDKEM